MATPSVEYRIIQLTKDQVAYVSPHRYEELSAFNWYAFWNKAGNNFYAVRCGRNLEGKRRIVFMHRQIKGLSIEDPRQVDHEDRKFTLDNTDSNLRIVDRFQQCQHRGRRRDNKSGFKGVHESKIGRFRAQIKARKKNYDLGYFDTAELAYAAYCRAAEKLHGEFACLE
jgi:hypothetical protein